ncbi:hypothetical protein A7X67_06990 [Clostridium sp. W14A]|nr:hypothetical protein A7X67_06990 [Clostridium sp. W14A]
MIPIKKIFKSYLAGRGVSEDQYWVLEFNNIKRDSTIHDFLDNLQNKFAKSNNIKDWTDDNIKGWENYKESYINNLINSEHITVQ